MGGRTLFRQVLEMSSFGVFVKFSLFFLFKAAVPHHRELGICSHMCAAVPDPLGCSHGPNFSLFSRTKQFPGECGYGQDPEDHGCSTEPLPGVSVLILGFTILCLGYLQSCAYVTKTALFCNAMFWLFFLLPFKKKKT